MEIGTKIKEARLRIEYTQEQVAQELGVADKQYQIGKRENPIPIL